MARRPRKTEDEMSLAERIAITVALTFLAGVAVLALFQRLSWMVPAWYASLSLVTFLVYGRDKTLSKLRWPRPYRISNAKLHLMGLAGGWPGAWVGQLHFHNRTLQLDFKIMLAVSAALHLWVLADYAFFA